MKTKKLASAIAIGAATVAMSLGAQATTQAPANQTTIQQEVKATAREERVTQKHVKQNVGGSGLDMVYYAPNYGMSPKEYGMRYGNGKSRKDKSNRLRLSHNAKLKRKA